MLTCALNGGFEIIIASFQFLRYNSLNPPLKGIKMATHSFGSNQYVSLFISFEKRNHYEKQRMKWVERI